MNSATSLEELTVYELKAVCRAKGLKVSGRKAELIDRVVAAGPGVDAGGSPGAGAAGKRSGTRGGRSRRPLPSRRTPATRTSRRASGPLRRSLELN